jgi:two-component system chemotaxis sensor kinase CheA
VSDDDEIIQAFLEESRENLDQLDRSLVALEDHPTDAALLAQIFRTIHTIKGTCGFFGFARLEALSHAGENLLGALRAGDLHLDAPITTSLLHLVDAVRDMLRDIEARGSEGEPDHRALIAELNAHLQRDAAPRPEPTGAGTVHAAPASETSVRVDVAVLDTLMDLVGELVLARGRIGELVADDDEGPLTSPYRKLRLVTSELQDGVMRARLQTVARVTDKFHRVVRDLAEALGKDVQLEIEGEDAGVDKAVNEALRDPLLHLVRNAVDHGIEAPEVRRAAGKPAEGHLRIRAFHEGGRLQVEVRDDGGGIDADRLVQRAVLAGMVSAEEAGVLSNNDALRLMFRPGLSTKDEITNVSGRGVGMDVVRANLEQVGGSIEVSSERGQGTTFRISVPLTLSIMPAVISWCGGQCYSIPQVDVQEVLQIDAEQVAALVDDVDGARIHRLRGRLLPLVELAAVLGVEARHDSGSLVIVVIENASRRFGLVVDAVGDTTEAVVKPLTRATSWIPAFAGVTILADGRPSLILDVAGVAALAGIQTTTARDEARILPGLGTAETSTLLVASGSGGDRLAIPLAAVRRLERFASESVERAGAIEVVHYRNSILPLVRVDRVLQGMGRSATGSNDGADIHAIVCDSSVGLVGLVVDRIEDVAARPPTPPQPPPRRGVSASLVVDERVTELIDVEALIADAGIGAMQ